MKDLLVKINAEIETFKAEAESLTEKGIKAAGPRGHYEENEIFGFVLVFFCSCKRKCSM